ncbi:hypothetical protein [Microvirga rosea]|uniref:hypothetical protein n=1 Tax=Microvirga rosea TaxID=2715425 RepID=UPI001D0B8542|nr:hypothetical protein [Microvirga rosea]MCB8820756.1 hypothetical protein [Microvirga rosea]
MKSTKAAIFVSVALSAGHIGSAAAQSAVYTEIKGEGCKQLRSEAEYSEWQCLGPVGQRVLFADMGLMFGVQFGKDAKLQPPFRAAAASIGNKIEWRLDTSGQPYASIFRAFVSEEINAPKKQQVHQVLVVTKIDGARACHMAYVNAKLQNANAKAAEIADTRAAGFKCGQDIPERIGEPQRFYDAESS